LHGEEEKPHMEAGHPAAVAVVIVLQEGVHQAAVEDILHRDRGVKLLQGDTAEVHFHQIAEVVLQKDEGKIHLQKEEVLHLCHVKK
jgi:hypothetical protein